MDPRIYGRDITLTGATMRMSASIHYGTSHPTTFVNEASFVMDRRESQILPNLPMSSTNDMWPMLDEWIHNGCAYCSSFAHWGAWMLVAGSPFEPQGDQRVLDVSLGFGETGGNRRVFLLT